MNSNFMPDSLFEKERQENLKRLRHDQKAMQTGRGFLQQSFFYQYSYQFDWLGLPIIQYPSDILALQNLIWTVKPDLIIETGVARGGSMIFYASMMELLGKGEVIGIEIELRDLNRKAIVEHPLAKRITILEGSSLDPHIVRQVKEKTSSHSTIMVALDSNHTHDHVLQELELYASFVTVGSYVIVFDTLLETMEKRFFFADRPWGKGNSPKTAVDAFLATHPEFEVDNTPEDPFLVTVSPSGFLKRIS